MMISGNDTAKDIPGKKNCCAFSPASQEAERPVLDEAEGRSGAFAECPADAVYGNSANSGKERILYPDLLRIIAAFGVIILHVSATGYYHKYEAGTMGWQMRNLYDSLSRFSVPVFVMVSGIFLLNPGNAYSLKKLYFSKILKIAIIYLFWSLFYAAVFVIQGKIRSGQDVSISLFAEKVLNGEYHLWFLFVICGLYMVSPVLRLIVRSENVMVYYLILSLVFVFGVHMLDLFPFSRKIADLSIRRFDVSLVTGFSGYFVWGYWLSTHKLGRNVRRIIYLAGIVAAVGTTVFNGVTESCFRTPDGYFFPSILAMATAVFVFFQYGFQGTSMPQRRRKLISLVGKWSFGIYLVHVFFCIALNYFSHRYPFLIPFTAIIIFFASLITVYVLDKIPVVNKYLI